MTRTELSRRTPPLVFGAIGVWVIMLFAGAGVLGAYAAQEGESGRTPTTWPTDAGIPSNTTLWTVVLAAHPKCPCTRASISELTQAMADTSEPSRLVVLAYEPAEEPGFAASPTLNRLGRRDNAIVIVDTDGDIAARFGGLTSGFVAVYDPAGTLRFAGGVTPTRSHTGPNTGAAAVRALLTDETPPAASAPVYGCPIQSDPDNLSNDGPALGSCVSDGANACTP